MQHESTAQPQTSLSTLSQHLYVLIFMVLLMTLANSLWPASRVPDYRPVELPPPIRSSDLYPAPLHVTP